MLVPPPGVEPMPPAAEAWSIKHWTAREVHNLTPFLNGQRREFPGNPVVGTLCFCCLGLSSIPGQGTKIPQATWHGQKNNNKNKIK